MRPIDQGNAEYIHQVSYPLLPVPLLQYQAMAEFYTTEPSAILIRQTEASNYLTFVQSLRCRMWRHGNSLEAFSIFMPDDSCNEGSAVDSLIVRRVYWDRSSDTVSVRMNMEIGKSNDEALKRLLDNYPDIRMDNIYVESGNSSQIHTVIDELDQLLSSGIQLQHVGVDEPRNGWGYFEISRTTSWGKITAEWGTSVGNVEIVNRMISLRDQAVIAINGSSEHIFEMSIDYSCIPEQFQQQIRYGNG